MCYAVPGKIVSIRDDNATVDYGGVTKEANISLMDSLSCGDYILVHAGFAIQKIDKAKGRAALDLLKDV